MGFKFKIVRPQTHILMPHEARTWPSTEKPHLLRRQGGVTVLSEQTP